MGTKVFEKNFDTKFKKIEKKLKMPYLHFIQMKLDSKGGQIERLDFNFQLHIITKISNIIKYLKNEKKNFKK